MASAACGELLHGGRAVGQAGVAACRVIVVAPGPGRCALAVLSRPLPFGFGGEPLARPGCVGAGIGQGDMNDRVIFLAFRRGVVGPVFQEIFGMDGFVARRFQNWANCAFVTGVSSIANGVSFAIVLPTVISFRFWLYE